MHSPMAIGSIAAATALLVSFVIATAAETKYPNLRGQWNTLSPRGSFDPDKPGGRGTSTQAPLTEEYKKISDLERCRTARGRAWLGDIVSMSAAGHAARHDRL